MNPADPNLPQLESVAHALGPLCDRFVFVGGCATGLLVTDPAASPVRATRDVDVVVEVVSLAGYHTLERQLEQAGFKHDRSEDAPVCRWIVGGCMLDVMPTDESVLGFGNRWYDVAVRTATHMLLPSGRSIRLIAPPAARGCMTTLQTCCCGKHNCLTRTRILTAGGKVGLHPDEIPLKAAAFRCLPNAASG